MPISNLIESIIWFGATGNSYNVSCMDFRRNIAYGFENNVYLKKKQVNLGQ